MLFLAFHLRELQVRVWRLLGTAVILLCVLFAGYQVQRSTAEYLPTNFTYGALYYSKLILGACIATFVVWKPKRCLRTAEALFLIISPFFPITAANTLWDYRASNLRDIVKGHAAGMLPVNSHRNRVIWIIFDELDQRILFDVRPRRIHLGEFDALRKESIYATSATSPNGGTLPSLQSLILGRKVGAYALATNDLRFRFEGCSKWHDFKSYPNIFSRARAAGFDTGLSGWHHPYCRLIGDDLSDCAWEINPQGFLVAERALALSSFFGKARYLAEWQAQTFPYRARFGIVTEPGGIAEIKQVSINTLEYVLGNAERMLRDPTLNLILIHMPIPHPPGIWDSNHGLTTTGKSDYVDNLQLANHSLALLRNVLQKNGEWDKATVLVSSDHPYRAAFWERIDFIRSPEMIGLTQERSGPFVPFLLKMPGQHSELTYTRDFNTGITSDLLLAALRGDISSPINAARWMNSHSSPPPCE